MEQFEQTILNALTTKFEGVDAKILGRIARKLAKTVASEEQAETAANGVTFQQILESYGDSRATDATQSAVANYEKKHGIKDGKPVEKVADPEPKNPQPATPNKPGEDIPAWAKQLIEDNKSLRERLDRQDKERLAKTRLDVFKSAISKAPETVRTRYERDFARLAFKDDEDFNSYLEEIKPDIEKMVTEQAQKGGTVSKPLAGGGKAGAVSKILQERLDERAAAPTSTAIQGLPTNTTQTKL